MRIRTAPLPPGAVLRRRRPATLPLAIRGWLVVAGAFLVMMAGYGAAYSYAAYAAALEEAFGTSRASISVIYGLCGFTAFAVSAVSGPLADRIGPRPLAAAGMTLVAVGLLTAATASTLLEIYLCYGLLIGLGVGFAYVPAVVAVQQRFTAGRGLASGIAAAGIGVGTALVPPAAGALATYGDWRTAFVILGFALAVIGILGAVLLAGAPERCQLQRDSQTLGEPSSQPGTLPACDAGKALRSRAFWLHYAGTLLVSVPVSLPFAHLVQSALDAGLARTEALALLSLLGISSIAGRFGLGALADRVGRRATFLGCCGAVAALMGCWAVADDHPALAAFAVLFGVASGGFVALLPAVITDRFGQRSAGSIIGVLYTGRGIALLIAAPVLAVLAERTGGYSQPLMLVGVLGAIGTAFLAAASRPA